MDQLLQMPSSTPNSTPKELPAIHSKSSASGTHGESGAVPEKASTNQRTSPQPAQELMRCIQYFMGNNYGI